MRLSEVPRKRQAPTQPQARSLPQAKLPLSHIPVFRCTVISEGSRSNSEVQCLSKEHPKSAAMFVKQVIHQNQ